MVFTQSVSGISEKTLPIQQITVKVLSSHMVGEILIDEIHHLSTFSKLR